MDILEAKRTKPIFSDSFFFFFFNERIKKKKKKTRGYRNLGKDLHKNKVVFFNIPNMTVCLKPHFGDNRLGPRVTV